MTGPGINQAYMNVPVNRPWVTERSLSEVTSGVTSDWTLITAGGGWEISAGR